MIYKPGTENEARTGPDRTPEALAFLAEVAEVCRRHGFAIGFDEKDVALVVYPDREPDEILFAWERKGLPS